MASDSSITILKDHGVEIAVLYRFGDGEPASQGRDIFEAIGGKRVVSGYSLTRSDEINGAGDMAVQLIAFCKSKIARERGRTVNSPGDLYLCPAGTRDGDYSYTLQCGDEGAPIHVEVHCNDDRIFRGTMAEFGAWLRTL